MQLAHRTRAPARRWWCVPRQSAPLALCNPTPPRALPPGLPCLQRLWFGSNLTALDAKSRNTSLSRKAEAANLGAGLRPVQGKKRGMHRALCKERCCSKPLHKGKNLVPKAKYRWQAKLLDVCPVSKCWRDAMSYIRLGKLTPCVSQLAKRGDRIEGRH